jgi:3-hydroxybutyrate dehydrogenase
MMKGKNALVTGSTSGIGQRIAERFAELGANVILNGFGDAVAIESQRLDLAKRTGVEVRYDPADLSDPAQIRAMTTKAIAEFGAIDVLVNNAGIQSFHTVRALLPGMKSRGWGRIINIASAHALVASPFKSAYVAAKHGIAGLTKTVALEVASQGITMNAVCPGYVWTPLVEKQIPETAKARGISEQSVIDDVLLHAQPTRKFVTVDQVAAFAMFLASDAAASITGAILPVDGGWTAQ